MSSRPVLLRCALTMFGALGFAACGGTERQFDPGADDAASTGNEDATGTPDVKADASAGDARADTVSASDGRSDAPPDAHPDAKGTIRSRCSSPSVRRSRTSRPGMPFIGRHAVWASVPKSPTSWN